MTEPTAAPRGWYPDPASPDRERWWTGWNWTDHTARWRLGDSLIPEYARSMRAGPNRSAARGIIILRITTVPVLLLIVVWVLTALRPTTVLLSVLLLGAFVTVGLSAWALVNGVQGLRSSAALGAKALSVHVIAGSCIDVATALILPAVLLAARTAPVS